jgi:hypothetical protein
VVRLRHLVVVVPGIAGSRLEAAGTGEPRWDVGLKQLSLTGTNPSQLSLSEHPDLVPAGATPAGVVPWLGVVHTLGRLTDDPGHLPVHPVGFPAIVQVTQRPAYITMLDAQDTPALTRLLAVSLADEASRRAAQVAWPKASLTR